MILLKNTNYNILLNMSSIITNIFIDDESVCHLKIFKLGCLY